MTVLVICAGAAVGFYIVFDLLSRRWITALKEDPEKRFSVLRLRSAVAVLCSLVLISPVLYGMVQGANRSSKALEPTRVVIGPTDHSTALPRSLWTMDFPGDVSVWGYPSGAVMFVHSLEGENGPIEGFLLYDPTGKLFWRYIESAGQGSNPPPHVAIVRETKTGYEFHYIGVTGSIYLVTIGRDGKWTKEMLSQDQSSGFGKEAIDAIALKSSSTDKWTEVPLPAGKYILRYLYDSKQAVTRVTLTQVRE